MLFIYSGVPNAYGIYKLSSTVLTLLRYCSMYWLCLNMALYVVCYTDVIPKLNKEDNDFQLQSVFDIMIIYLR